MKKYCNFCDKNRPESDFHWRNKTLGTRISRCRFCWSEYSKTHYKKNKGMYIKKARKWNNDKLDKQAKFLLEYFKKHPCVDCGEADPVVLTFDHVRGKKNFNISGASGHKNWKAILKEIAKCVVRCANCHLRKTAQRGKWRKFRFALFVQR